MSFPKIISIEGNIGAGKTTILKNLESYYSDNPNVVFLREPVDIWETITDKNGENILAKFYADPSKYSFSFQVMAFVTRLSMLRQVIDKNPDCQLIICERSLEADRHIFAKMLYDDGLIDEINYKIYLHFYNEYRNDFVLDGIIYIQTDPTICDERIKLRSRNGESGIQLDYLKKCRQYHEDWLMEIDNILIINADENVKYDRKDSNDSGNKWIDIILEYINDLLNNEDTTVRYSDDEGDDDIDWIGMLVKNIYKKIRSFTSSS
jgi:deoxyadenosine/deoxycytidine kinase